MSELKAERFRNIYAKVNELYTKDIKTIKEACKILNISYGTYDKAKKFVQKEKGIVTEKRQYNKNINI